MTDRLRFSVLIPVFNGELVVGHAIDSALAQTVPPHEIVVFDDGSTDDTASVLATYGARVRVFAGSNQGVAAARNFMCAHATGDYVAFLDADDVWHSRYLEVQQELIARHPEAIASFTRQETFATSGAYRWTADLAPATVPSELVGAREFLERYNRTPLQFQMSCFCMPARELARIDGEPFYVGASGADDTYIHNLLPLLGPIAHTGAAAVAYRITPGSISSNRLRMSLLVVGAFDELAARYAAAPTDLLHAFAATRASRKRNCGKYLMGAGQTREARRQFLGSLTDCATPTSLLKSLGLLGLTLVPTLLQPPWPHVERDGRPPARRAERAKAAQLGRR